MKFLETRTEIAKAVNFKQYPTIRIDVSKTDDYGIVGTHVLIDNGPSVPESPTSSRLPSGPSATRAT